MSGGYLKLYLKFKTGPCAVPNWEFLWPLKFVIFSAVFKAVVATVLKMNPHIKNVKVLSLPPECDIRGREKFLIPA